MTGKLVDRRSVLGQAAAATYALAAAKWALAVSAAQRRRGSPRPAGPAGIVFSPNTVKTEAKRLSDQPFSKPTMELPKPFDKLSYDQYRDIRFRPEKAIWKDDHLDFQVQPFAMGWLYDMPVDLWTVDDGTATRLVADSKLFSFGPLIGPGPDAAPYGFSGFRIHGPINRADYFDEYAVFQGASYLRAVGRDEGYGASARGLALNTARPGGEEFPFFRSFWLEKPKPGATEIVVHALLDSQSTTGAYRFVIAPGEITTMDVEAILYPRTALQHVGIAPLTSMFLHGQASQRSSNDFRPAVHDSEGLAMVNGSGERIWRPLNNPKTLQVSAFMDKSPKGFGLLAARPLFQQFRRSRSALRAASERLGRTQGIVGRRVRRAHRNTGGRRNSRQRRRLLETCGGSRRRWSARFCLQAVLGRGRSAGVVRCARSQDPDRRVEKTAYRSIRHRSDRSVGQRCS